VVTQEAVLIADIGATYVRLAPSTSAGLGEPKVYRTREFDSVQSAISTYQREVNIKFSRAAVAAAGPVFDHKVSLVNVNWSFSCDDLEKAFGFKEVLLFNDFEAAAMAIPKMIDQFERDRPKHDLHKPSKSPFNHDLLKIGGGSRISIEPMAILGPGTGLGVAGLVRGTNGEWVSVAGEGGHATMAAGTEEENAILDLLRLRWGHLSAERVLSGSGLVDIYQCLCLLHGVRPGPYREPPEITKAAFEAKPADPICSGAFRLFGSMLGTFAGNVALMFGAKGGVFISGGILPRYTEQFIASPFRLHFESKGRLSGYVQSIPTYLVLHPAPALQGLVDLLDVNRRQNRIPHR
jgi:glucokinase